MALRAIVERGGESAPFQLAGLPAIEPSTGDVQLWEYAQGHLGFFGFLKVADLRIGRRVMVGLMDLPDRLWRDAYDDGAHPVEAADDALAEEGCEA